MSVQKDDAKQTVQNYLAAFNDQDEEALKEHLADDVVEHGIHDTHHGPEEVVELHRSHFDVFPDYSGSTEAMIAEDNIVTVRYTASGTQTAEFEDIEPTQHKAEWSGMVQYRIEDDEIAEIWIEEDRLGLLEQLEAVDPPAHLRI
ncbi:ester cyclase [Natronoarchaeum sp. GCM10025703]|uniref:ester cyclase n=1 Tax=Natronoarchaeum sp. GCM10025703 TaxID=3252685 RepID=UPI003608380D